ncbi:MAG: hypothetical protein M5U31_07290 [Acidimicrobiia bacterium]|nr:hypothetical protein [Acidimicrobiia bacterium]
MDLWSKGLGKRVLSLALAERESLATRDDDLVIEGVMHAPTFWDYEVTLDRRDITEFLDLLQRPETVRFVIEDEHRTKILSTALSSALIFAGRTLRLLVTGSPPPEVPETDTPMKEVGTSGRA